MRPRPAPQKDAAFAFRFKIEKEGTLRRRRRPLLSWYPRSDRILPTAFTPGSDSISGCPSCRPIRKSETPILIKPSPKSDTVTLEWSRQDERTVIGRLHAPKNVTVHLVHYFPWDFKGRYRVLPDGAGPGR